MDWRAALDRERLKMRTVITAGIASFILSGCAGSQDGMPPATAPASSGTATTSAVVPGGLVAPSTPEALAAPGDQVVLMKASARGAQIYVCKAKADAAATFEWSLKAPEADLTDDQGNKIGKHYAGPTWEAVDGSKVVGQKKAQADAPEAGAIPWLLLEAKSNEGAGTMGHVKTIQRVDTHGGKAPTEGCDVAHANAETRVPYTATYYFYGAR
jgi:hypothetical protein